MAGSWLAEVSQFSNSEVLELGWKDDPGFRKLLYQLLGAALKARWRDAGLLHQNSDSTWSLFLSVYKVLTFQGNRLVSRSVKNLPHNTMTEKIFFILNVYYILYVQYRK